MKNIISKMINSILNRRMGFLPSFSMHNRFISKRRRIFLPAIAKAVLSLSLIQSAHAEWSTVPNEQVHLWGWLDPMMISDGNGGCWVTSRNDAAKIEHVDRYGNLSWDEPLTLLPNRESNGVSSVKAANSDAICQVTIFDEEDPYVTYVRLQRVNKNGDLLWGDEGIRFDSTDRMIQRSAPLTRGPGEDTYLVYWKRYSDNQHEEEYRLQLFNGDGEMLWGPEGVPMGKYFRQFVITENDEIITARTQNPYVEIIKLDDEGNDIWGDEGPKVYGYEEQHVLLEDIESDREGGIILVMECERIPDNEETEYFGIKAVRITNEGEVAWERLLYEREKNHGEGFSIIDPVINYADSGRFFIAWADNGRTFQVVSIDVDGENLWDEPVEVIQNTTSYGDFKGIDSHSSVCYVWRDHENPRISNEFGVIQLYGQRINADGQRLWGNRGKSIQAKNINMMRAVTDTDGGVITCLNSTITVQMINRNGEIGVVLDTPVENDQGNSNLPPSSFILSPPHPNPFNSHLQINFSLPVTGMTSLKIFDISGREVEIIFNDDLKPGYYSQTWNASGISSGIYLLKLQAGDQTQVCKVVLTR